MDRDGIAAARRPWLTIPGGPALRELKLGGRRELVITLDAEAARLKLEATDQQPLAGQVAAAWPRG